MKDGLLIGEVVTRSGTSRKALRLYEARGILPPPRRTAAGYRVYPANTLSVLAFVQQSRRLGLTLTEIQHIVALRRAGAAPCPHVHKLLERKASDLAALLKAVRRILTTWRSTDNHSAAVCPHIEANGGEVTWIGTLSRSARRAINAPKSSSKATRSGSAKTRTPPSSSRRNGTSSST
jgi:MerR family copper efflux transcriptional regulator